MPFYKAKTPPVLIAQVFYLIFQTNDDIKIIIIIIMSWFSDLTNTINDGFSDLYQGAADLLGPDDENQLMAKKVREQQRLKLKEQQERLDKLYHQGRAQGYKVEMDLQKKQAQAQHELAQYKRKAYEQIQKQKLQNKIQQDKADLDWKILKDSQYYNPTFKKGAQIVARQAGSHLWETTKDVGQFAGQTLKSAYTGVLDTIGGLARTGTGINNAGQGTNNILKGNLWEGTKQLAQGSWQGATGGLQLGGGLIAAGAAAVPFALAAYGAKKARNSDQYKQYQQFIKQGGKLSDFALKKLQDSGQLVAKSAMKGANVAMKGANVAKFGLKHGMNALVNPNKLGVAYSLLKDTKNQLVSKSKSIIQEKKRSMKEKLSQKAGNLKGKLANMYDSIVKKKTQTQQLPVQIIQQQPEQQQIILQQTNQDQEMPEQTEISTPQIKKTKKIQKGRAPGPYLSVQDKTKTPKNFKSIQHKETLQNERMVQQYNK